MRNNHSSAEHPPKHEAPPAAEAQEGSQAPALSANIQEQQQAAIALSLQSRYVPRATLRRAVSRASLARLLWWWQPALVHSQLSSAHGPITNAWAPSSVLLSAAVLALGWAGHRVGCDSRCRLRHLSSCTHLTSHHDELLSAAVTGPCFFRTAFTLGVQCTCAPPPVCGSGGCTLPPLRGLCCQCRLLSLPEGSNPPHSWHLRACPSTLLPLALGASSPCRSLFLLEGTNPARLLLIRVTTSPWFEGFVLLLILASSVVLALDRPGLEPQSRLAQAIRVCNVIFAYAFLAEAVLKVRTHSVGHWHPLALAWLWQPIHCCGWGHGEGPLGCRVVRLDLVFAFLAEALLKARHAKVLRYDMAAASWLSWLVHQGWADGQQELCEARSNMPS